MKRSGTHRIKLFALSFGVSVVVLSVIFIPIMLRVSPLQTYTPPQGSAVSQALAAYTPAAADSLTVLVIVTENGSARYFLLIRFDPINARLPVASLPYTMQIKTAQKTDTLAGFDAYGGTLTVKGMLESALDIKIDRTARMTVDDFIKSVNILGTVKYTLPYSLIYKDTKNNTYINIPKGTQTLVGRNIYDMFRFPSYTEGEEHRYKVQSDLLAKLFNERVDEWLVQHGDSVFNTMVNLADTDISYNDYANRRAALGYLATEVEEPSIPIFPGGQYNAKSFSISQQSVDTMRMYFGGANGASSAASSSAAEGSAS